MRSERVDTRALLNGDPGTANLTNPRQRLEERAKVLAYWPDDVIVPVRDGYRTPPPWRLLLDPTAWHDVPATTVHDYVRGWLLFGKWPSIDTLHRAFGRVTNHRAGDENPTQEALL